MQAVSAESYVSSLTHRAAHSRASRIHVVLLSTTGTRETWHKPSVDRRGEATVCLVEGTSAPRPDSGAAEAQDYGVVPLSLRQIRCIITVALV